jgi:hypothetical protein
MGNQTLVGGGTHTGSQATTTGFLIHISNRTVTILKQILQGMELGVVDGGMAL